MKLHHLLQLSFVAILFSSCASGYKTINPNTLTYQSTAADKGVTLDYKYNLLYRRYAKKETNNRVRLVAVKIVNTSGRDLVFGKDITLTYTNGNVISMMDQQRTYHELKQGSIGYLLYLLLTPAKLTTATNGVETNSIPVGYAIGPGLALGNIIAAGSANKNFEEELMKYNVEGTVIKNGETKYGLIGINADNFDAIKVKIN